MTLRWSPSTFIPPPPVAVHPPFAPSTAGGRGTRHCGRWNQEGHEGGAAPSGQWSSFRAFLDFRGISPGRFPRRRLTTDGKTSAPGPLMPPLAQRVGEGRQYTHGTTTTTTTTRWLSGCTQGAWRFSSPPSDRTGISRLYRELSAPDRDFVAGEDRRIGCPPAPRSQKAAAAAPHPCDDSHLKKSIIPERTRPLADNRGISALSRENQKTS